MDKLKMKLKQADWWEITYLIIYGAVFTFEFLNTTMFEIKWPPRFAFLFMGAIALYTIAKFIWHNTYTKKETIWAGIILFAFIMPAVLTEYRFLWCVGFLIVAAKDVEFDKILKVYLTLGITIMLAAFVASQCGWIENLQYTVWREQQVVYRESFGSVYPTDFAAHIFYLAIAGICMSENRITWGKIVNFVVLGIIVLDKCGARTSAVCLLLIAVLLIAVKYLKGKIKIDVVYHMLNLSTLVLAGLFLSLVHIYDTSKEWIVKLDAMLSSRLAISNKAISLYDYKLFGQNILEVGLGRQEEPRPDYFFLDSSYIRVALLYGVVLLSVVLIVFWLAGQKAIINKRIIIVISIMVIAIHSFMEHHILEIAYNPILCFVFAKCNLIEDKGCLEDSNVS